MTILAHRTPKIQDKSVLARAKGTPKPTKAAPRKKSLPKQPSFLDRWLADHGGDVLTPKQKPAKIGQLSPKKLVHRTKKDLELWLANHYDEMRVLARKYLALSRSHHKCKSADDLDNLLADIAVSVLESTDAPIHEDEFTRWLDGLGKKSACGILSTEQEQPGSMDTDIIGAVVVDESQIEDEPMFENASEMVKYERNLRARVKRAISKLSVAHQDVLTKKYFSKLSLTDTAKAAGRCASSDRMRLLRAKKKLAELIDYHGYTLAA